MWVHDERRNIICMLYAAVRRHTEADLLLRQYACIGSNMLQKSYSQTFNAFVIKFDMSPGCSVAMQRLFRLQLRSRPLCDLGHKGHAIDIQRLLLWTTSAHFLGNSCTSNSPEYTRGNDCRRHASLCRFFILAEKCNHTDRTSRCRPD
jgi:hypothetical protein